MIRVGLLSPTMAARVGLRALLEAESQIEVLFEASSLAELPDEPLGVDVLILTSDSLSRQDFDLFMLEDHPEVALLLLGDDADVLRNLAELGFRAWGVLLPDSSQEELLAAVVALYEGLIVGEPSMLVSLIDSTAVAHERFDEQIEALTEREQEVLQLLAQGLANKQIAVQLGISPHTVKFHISSIYGKLGATNRTEAVRIGLQAGLILL